eukprot:6491588-Amphidinium_carterae.1
MATPCISLFPTTPLLVYMTYAPKFSFTLPTRCVSWSSKALKSSFSISLTSSTRRPDLTQPLQFQLATFKDEASMRQGGTVPVFKRQRGLLGYGCRTRHGSHPRRDLGRESICSVLSTLLLRGSKPFKSFQKTFMVP